MPSKLLGRDATLQSITVEELAGVDGQGKPSYGTAQTTNGVVRYTDEVVTMADGSKVGTSLTVWIPSTQTVFPNEQARLTVEGTTYIVVQSKDVKDFKNTLSHRRVRCQVE